MLIILGILNTFSVYIFVEKYIIIKYILIGIQTLLVLLIINKNKLINKFKYIEYTNIGLFVITLAMYIFLLSNHLNINNNVGYGYYLTLIGIIIQVIYFILDNIKLNEVYPFIITQNLFKCDGVVDKYYIISWETSKREKRKSSSNK